MKRWPLAILILVVMGLLAACAAPVAPISAPAGENTSAEAAPSRTRLVAAAPMLPDILDAQQGYGGGYLDIEQIGQALFRIDPTTGELVPDLVESWSFSEDGTIMTITLPEGAQYANGDPLDAQALADAWWRYKELSPFASDLASLIDTEVVDATTLNAIFDAPPAALFAVLETSYGGPWNVVAATAAGNEAFAVNPIASGPLMVQEFTPLSDLLLVRNENYRTNLPFVENKGALHITELQVRAIAEEMILAGELETGAVDIILNAPASAIERLRANPDIQLFEIVMPGYVGLAMNHQHPIFSDVRVRQAIAQTVDRDSLAKALGAVAAPQYAFINKAMIAYSPEMEAQAQERYPYDLEAAKAILAEAGWSDGDGDGIAEKDGEPFSVEIIVNANNSAQDLASQVLQAQLKEIGVDVQIVKLEGAAAREAMVAGDYDMGFDAIAWRDPDIFSIAFAAPFWNLPKYDNPTAVELMEQARYLLDPAERSAAYAELQTIWLEDVVEIPLWEIRRFQAARTWVKGLIVNPTTGQILLNDVTIEE